VEKGHFLGRNFLVVEIGLLNSPPAKDAGNLLLPRRQAEECTGLIRAHDSKSPCHKANVESV
jgi:hypothetical protein